MQHGEYKCVMTLIDSTLCFSQMYFPLDYLHIRYKNNMYNSLIITNSDDSIYINNEQKI